LPDYFRSAVFWLVEVSVNQKLIKLKFFIPK